MVIPQDVDPYVYDNGEKLSPFTFTITGGKEITELHRYTFSVFSGNGGSRLLSRYMLMALGLMLMQVYITNKILGKE